MHGRLPLYDSSGLRALERAAIAQTGGDDALLMQRAGQGGWRCLLARWPQAQAITVACGPGNNGGDGYVLAAHALAGGRQVQVVHAAGHMPRTALARRFHDAFVAGGGRVNEFSGALDPGDVIVDAVFGIGLNRAPDAGAAALIDTINTAHAPVLALDTPSGVDANTGAVPGTAVIAECTLQFIAAHAGLYTGAALDQGGVLLLDDLDLDITSFADSAPAAWLLQPEALQYWLRPRARDSHKGLHGHVLCLGGDTGMAGAVALCAHAALRSGSGLVSIGSRGAHLPGLLALLPEVMCHAVDSTAALAVLLERASVIAIGPGLGTTARARAMLAQVLRRDTQKVIDADALNLLVRLPRTVGDAVLTPHPGEAARLLDCSSAQVQGDRFTAAKTLAETFAAAVVLKGAGSVIAMPAKTPCVIGAGNPGMAVGGMGDVLTGVIAALRAQGLSAFDAAACGALVHAHAGDIAATAGERGMLPRDVIACLRGVVNPSSPP